MPIWHERTPISITNPFCQETHRQTQPKKKVVQVALIAFRSMLTGGSWGVKEAFTMIFFTRSCSWRCRHISHPSWRCRHISHPKVTMANEPPPPTNHFPICFVVGSFSAPLLEKQRWLPRPAMRSRRPQRRAMRQRDIPMAEISRAGTVLELKHFTISWCVDLFIVQHMPQVELILSCEHLWACLLREKAINISGCSVMPQCVHRVYIVPQETQYVLKSDASMQTKQRAHLIWAPPTKSRKFMKKSAKNEAKRKTFKSKHNQEKNATKKDENERIKNERCWKTWNLLKDIKLNVLYWNWW